MSFRSIYAREVRARRAGLVGLVALPAAITFGLTEYDLIRELRFVGLGNFRELWWDAMYWTALGNSLLFILFAVPLRLLAAVALALLLHRRFRGAGAYRTSRTCRRSSRTSPTRCCGSGSSIRCTAR